MADTLSPAMAYGTEFYPPQATVSLSETSLENCLMTPGPTSPESSYVKSEMGDGDEPRKPTKKRKSWGQELPTPKTNLPPRYDITITTTTVASTYTHYRKRAKTEDEKEQRRIERVLRNRQAAQSSRERKRQEVEKLEGEKQTIEQQNESLKQRLMKVEHEKFLLAQTVAKLAAQMKAFQRGDSTPHVQLSPPLEPDLLEHDQIMKQELDENPFHLPTPQQSLYASSASFSPQSTATYSSSSTPATINLGVDELTASPDMTQHPAAMLCDLQCQSAEACQPSTQPTTRPEAAKWTPSSSATNRIVCLMLTLAVYSQLMLPLRMIFIFLKMSSPLPPSMMTSMPMALPLTRWLISTPTNLLPTPTTSRTTPNSTTKTSHTTATSTLRDTPLRASILRLRLLRRLLLSSPSLARPLRAATGRALRAKTASITGRRVALERGIRSVARRYGEKAGLGNGVRRIRLGAGFEERRKCSTRRLRDGRRR